MTSQQDTDQNTPTNTLDNIKAYSISLNGLDGRVKSPIVWGHWGSVIAPIAYIRKPKWLSESDFKKVVESLELRIELETPNQEEEME